MPLAAGTRIGSYEILAPLGAGGMGEVYRARDSRLGREVALKVLPHDVAAHPDRLARFEREARTVAALNHPNIVTLFSVEDADGARFLTMELVEGQSLDHALVPGGLPVARVLELGIALADALAAAHEKGVVHRDLKPANVMLTKDGRLKVLDFGLAKLATPDSDPALTQAATVVTPISGVGLVAGTVPYMAPEQIRGEAVDARSDLFALGVVLYELASGKRPFTGETHVDVSHAILRNAPRPLSGVRPGLPPDLQRIIGECLEKNARERVQAALDVSNALRRLRKELERNESGAVTRPAPERVASIAVLPFVNRSASVDDEYFSDGLADELLNVLAKIKGLRVIARTSSFQFKGVKDDTATIGRKLDVATLLEGSVRKAGNRVRISVQLVNVADSSHLWSETYDRTLEDIFAVQDDIAQSVVKELRTTLLGEAADSDASGKAKAEVARAAKGRAAGPEAHRLFLLGRHLNDRSNPDDTALAIAQLEEAVRLEPDYALAWAELGGACANLANFGTSSTEELWTRARIAVERSLSLEPDLAEGHARLGWLRLYHDWDWIGARTSLTRALELSPRDGGALLTMGTLLYSMGRYEESVEMGRRAVEHDPLNARAHHILGIRLRNLGRDSEAEQEFRAALALVPQRAYTRGSLGLSLAALGRTEEALAEVSREPAAPMRFWALAQIGHALGRTAESDAALEELIAQHSDTAAYQVAEVCAARGEIDRAFEWLERARVQQDPGLIGTLGSPPLRTLHGDPRWREFLQAMKLDNSPTG